MPGLNTKIDQRWNNFNQKLPFKRVVIDAIIALYWAIQRCCANPPLKATLQITQRQQNDVAPSSQAGITVMMGIQLH